LDIGRKDPTTNEDRPKGIVQFLPLLASGMLIGRSIPAQTSLHLNPQILITTCGAFLSLPGEKKAWLKFFLATAARKKECGGGKWLKMKLTELYIEPGRNGF